MIRFDHEGKLYGIQFKYGTVPPAGHLPERRTIECKILVGETVDTKYEDMNLVANATVTQDTRDVFVRAEGRKRVLTKTLKLIPQPELKPFRTKLWEVYHSRVSKKGLHQLSDMQQI